jgi:uncharacterized membrane protein
MRRILLLALIALPMMLVLDFLWVGIIANGFYHTQLGALYSSTVVWPAILIFYPLYVLGLAYFVVSPALKARSLSLAALSGAFFGLVAIGTYDLTNLAIVPNWSLLLTIVDMTWGTFEAALVCAATYLIATKLLKW